MMQRFGKLDAMQQLALVACAQMTPEAETFSCKSPVPWYDMFFALDENEDGRIDFAEFVRGFRQLQGSGACGNVPDDTIDSIIRAIDLNCSGAIDWTEWVAVSLLGNCNIGIAEEPLRTAFRLLDRPSDDGTIGAVDLLALLDSGSFGMSFSAAFGRKVARHILGPWMAPLPITFDRKEETEAGSGSSYFPRKPKRTPALALLDVQ